MEATACYRQADIATSHREILGHYLGNVFHRSSNPETYYQIAESLPKSAGDMRLLL